MEVSADSVGKLSEYGPGLKKKRRPRRPKLLTRDQLDGRTVVAREYDRLEAAIIADLGGEDALSAIERSLVEGFCGATVILKDLNARIALGQAIDITDLAQAISSMVRIASRLGEQRRLRDVGSAVAPRNGVSPLRTSIDVEIAGAS